MRTEPDLILQPCPCGIGKEFIIAKYGTVLGYDENVTIKSFYQYHLIMTTNSNTTGNLFMII
jgi:hypothetical protein